MVVYEVVVLVGSGTIHDHRGLPTKCMVMREVKRVNSETLTSSCIRGCFRADPKTWSQFLDLLRIRA